MHLFLYLIFPGNKLLSTLDYFYVPTNLAAILLILSKNQYVIFTSSPFLIECKIIICSINFSSAFQLRLAWKSMQRTTLSLNQKKTYLNDYSDIRMI